MQITVGECIRWDSAVEKHIWKKNGILIFVKDVHHSVCKKHDSYCMNEDRVSFW